MRKDGKKIFDIKGVYTAPSFDFRPKLTELLESAVGYTYPEFTEKGIIDSVPDDIPFGDEYLLFIASPAEEPLRLVTELFNTILSQTSDNNHQVLFTYLAEVHGETFSQEQIDSLVNIGEMVEKLGGKFVKSNSIEMLAGILNTITAFT
jgi:hypothetical protein